MQNYSHLRNFNLFRFNYIGNSDYVCHFRLIWGLFGRLSGVVYTQIKPTLSCQRRDGVVEPPFACGVKAVLLDWLIAKFILAIDREEVGGVVAALAAAVCRSVTLPRAWSYWESIVPSGTFTLFPELSTPNAHSPVVLVPLLSSSETLFLLSAISCYFREKK